MTSEPTAAPTALERTVRAVRQSMTPSGLGWLLVIAGLAAGFVVGSSLGSSEDPTDHTEASAYEAESNPGALAIGSTPDHERLDSEDRSANPSDAAEVAGAEQDGFDPAALDRGEIDQEAHDHHDLASTDAGRREIDRAMLEQARRDRDEADQGGVVARYDPVPIDTLPVHQDEGAGRSVDSLTIVTRGRIGAGESLGSSLRRQGISPGTVHLIASEMRKVFDFRRSRPGDRYRLGQDADGRVLDFRYAQGPEESFYLAWEGTRYVVRKETAELQPQIAKIAGVVDSSFYGAILALGEQTSLANEFARIFAWDIDFTRNVHPGDEFQILYERLYRRNDDGEEVYVRPGRVLAARYAGNVGEHTVVYFEDDRGVGAYFRPDGSSVERAFLAAPLEFSRISSRFTRARRHPILNVTRPHPGIDYAAPLGTPIWAVADGTVEYRARAGASGNLVRIRHAGGYTSHYAHLSRFAKGLEVGDRVEQKQLIGYVGSTGLSTGPHVCFRVKKNGRYVDPMRISSPAGPAVPSEELVSFESVRDELLADLGTGPLSVVDEAL